MSNMTFSKTQTIPRVVGTTPVTILSAEPYPRRVRILANRIVVIQIGLNAIADESDSFPVAEMTETFFNIGANDVMSAQVITGETTGTLWVTEV